MTDLKDIPIADLKKAVALKYNGESAPTMVAKGEHDFAEKIMDLAEEHNIPLCDNPALVDLLSRLEIGDQIPKELYISVAYILAFAYEMTYLSGAD